MVHRMHLGIRDFPMASSVTMLPLLKRLRHQTCCDLRAMCCGTFLRARGMPEFAVLPFSLREVFVQSVATLSGDLRTMHMLSDEISSEESANRILQAAFDYGYTRRGGVATIDIAVRSQEGKPNGVLLDLDWHTQLSPSQLPAPEVWQTTFVPALATVRYHLIRQSDRTRIQIHCQLPLPAAFAVGFLFNLRVARIGVWARRTQVSDFKQQLWLSDGSAADVSYTPLWIKKADHTQTSAIIELTSYTKIHAAVARFVQDVRLKWTHGCNSTSGWTANL